MRHCLRHQRRSEVVGPINCLPQNGFAGSLRRPDGRLVFRHSGPGWLAYLDGHFRIVRQRLDCCCISSSVLGSTPFAQFTLSTCRTVHSRCAAICAFAGVRYAWPLSGRFLTASKGTNERPHPPCRCHVSVLLSYYPQTAPISTAPSLKWYGHTGL